MRNRIFALKIIVVVLIFAFPAGAESTKVKTVNSNPEMTVVTDGPICPYSKNPPSGSLLEKRI
ncbi:MAG: hypothetical protein ACOCU7_04320 [Tangfeifania sp.]